MDTIKPGTTLKIRFASCDACPADACHSSPRPLEVSTAPSTPSLKIISPTPRAFTFPASHNLSDSPFSSPPNSPFERDLRVLDASSASPASTPSPSVSSSHDDDPRSPPPLSAFTHTLFPAPAAVPPSLAPSISQTVLGSPFEERRPKKGDDDYVKRPENAFILFRRQCCEDLALSVSSAAPSPTPSGSSSAPPAPKKPRQADLSRTISQRWKALSPEERAHWDDLAKEKKRQHEMLHPNYVYRPRRSGAKNRTSSASTATAPVSPTAALRRKNSAPLPPQIEFVLPAERSPHARSASSPPYQTFQVPNVYASPPSAVFPSDGSGDDTTSLMSLILQSNPGGVFSFDYVPNFQSSATLEPTALLQPMFSLGDAGSPASSTGSSPSSPYTPASNTSFHPSIFTSSSSPSNSHSQSQIQPDANANTDMALGLYDPASAASHGFTEADYTSYPSAWLTASPWAPGCAGSDSHSLAAGDFELAGVPGMEIQWGLPPMNELAFPTLDGGPYNAQGEIRIGEHNTEGVFDGVGDMNFEDIFSMRS